MEELQATQTMQRDYNLRSKGLVPSTSSPTQPVAPPKNTTVSAQPKKTTVSSTPLLAMEYNVMEDMKKTKVNVFMYDICSIPQQRKLLLNTFSRPPDPLQRTVANAEIKYQYVVQDKSDVKQKDETK